MTAARRLTVDQWAELDDKDWRELVDGKLEEAEMPASLHDFVLSWLVMLLGPYFMKRRGVVAPSGPKLVIRTDRGRVPDLVCYRAGNMPEIEGLVRRAPDIVVEIISPRPRDIRRDRIEKLADYAEMGAKQYWLVDPKLRTFEIWSLDKNKKYQPIVTAARGKIRKIPTLPALVVDVDELWAEVDRLEAACAR